jgi:hypothetical protein
MSTPRLRTGAPAAPPQPAGTGRARNAKSAPVVTRPPTVQRMR